MTIRFEVGEVATFFAIGKVHPQIYVSRHCLAISGQDVTITGGPSTDEFGFERYPVVLADGRQAAPLTLCLRKKRPPEEIGDWSHLESIARWNPTRVPA